MSDKEHRDRIAELLMQQPQLAAPLDPAQIDPARENTWYQVGDTDLYRGDEISPPLGEQTQDRNRIDPLQELELNYAKTYRQDDI